jgi:hypothetical protein
MTQRHVTPRHLHTLAERRGNRSLAAAAFATMERQAAARIRQRR